MNVSILGKDLPVILPPRHAERHELAIMYSQNAVRGAAAILGMCVPALWEKTGAGLTAAFSYKSCGYDAGEYGARVWEVLKAAGLGEAEIIGAGSPVFMELAKHISPTVAEVGEQKDFSGASGEA